MTEKAFAAVADTATIVETTTAASKKPRQRPAELLPEPEMKSPNGWPTDYASTHREDISTLAMVRAAAIVAGSDRTYQWKTTREAVVKDENGKDKAVEFKGLTISIPDNNRTGGIEMRDLADAIRHQVTSKLYDFKQAPDDQVSVYVIGETKGEFTVEVRSDYLDLLRPKSPAR